MAIKRTRSEVDVREFGHIRVWRDDLVAVVNTVAEAAEDIKLSTPDFTLDDVDDLAQVSDPRVGEFRLTANHGKVILQLSPTSASLSLTDPDLRARGMATEVERILRTRQRFFRQHRTAFMVALAVAVITLGAILVWLNPNAISSTDLMTSLAVAIAALTLTTATASVLSPGRSASSSAIVYTRTHQEAPPWTVRNKDALATNAVVSLVFLVLGIIVGYILPK
nr:hypothetical protein OHB51_17235 [Micromonospora sp. NBC_00855]